MGLTVNDFREAEFEEGDVIDFLKSRKGASDLVSSEFVTRSEMQGFVSSPGSFVHDGSVFKQDIDSLKHAIEYTYTRTGSSHNGYENFLKGLEGLGPAKFFANVASRTGGLASVTRAIENVDVVSGENIGIIESFTQLEHDFVKGEEYPATGNNQVTISEVDYVLPSSKIGKSIGISSDKEYPDGTILIITATPLAGWQLKKWEGEYSSGVPVITVTLRNNFYIEAVFEGA
jgi:hypothetical protein